VQASGLEERANAGSSPPRVARQREGSFRYRLRFLPMLLRLYWYRLRQQPAQEALALLGIAAGVALIFAVEIANTSVPASVRDLERGIAGNASFEVAARSPEGFNEGLVTKVGEAQGVSGDSGILVARVTVIGPRGQLPLTLVGADAGISAIGGPIARNFPWQTLTSAAPAGVQPAALASRLRGAHMDTIALPEGAAHALGASAGQFLSIDVAGRSVVVLCGGILSAAQVGPASESPFAVALLPAAQRITGLAHRVTRIVVLPQRGREALAKHVLTRRFGSTLNVRSGDSEVALLEGATRSSNQAATAFTALSVIVGLLFAYNAMLLTLPARRRYVTRLRNQGAYRHELAGLMALEVLALGAVASLVGLVLGDLLSRAVFGSVPGYLAAGFAIGSQRVITPMAVLVSIGGGLLATIVAAVGPSISTLRGHPLEQASDTADISPSLGSLSGPVGLAVGGAAIVVAIAVTVLVPGSGVVAVGALAVGLGFVLAPAVPWLIQRSVGLATRLSSPVSFIATTELRAAPMRATAVAATSAIAVYAIVAIGGATNDISRGAANATKELAGHGAKVAVWPDRIGQSPFPVQPFAPESAIATLRANRAVAWVDVLRGAFLDVGSRRLFVLAKPQGESTPVSASQIIQGDPNATARRLREGGWAALSATVAGEWHLHIGDRFVLPTPSGYHAFRLAATITNYGWPPGAVIMLANEYTHLWQTKNVTGLRVGLRDGIGEEQGLRTVQRALHGTGLYVITARHAEADISAVASQGMSQLSQIATLLLAAAILAVVAAMAGSIWQRRPRLANLKRLGMYRGELVRTIYLETGVVVAIGCVVGAVFGLFGQPIVTLYVRQSTGFPEIYSPAFGLGVRTLVMATVLAVLATGLLGYLVTRRSVVWESIA
jgi:putative ABC transport system permease protein